ncbi:MAG: histidine phosphatase family protein [Thiobacillus sp.]|nr:histidine phosphatase family protein [Thiobacillus sp.]
MNRMRGMRLLLAGVMYVVGMVATPAVGASEAAWQKLAQGGKVVLLRHGAVRSGPGQGNSLLRDPTCKRERNLSVEGEAQARRIGEAFRARNIPVAAVRHSPFCRTADTARLAFSGGAPADYLSLREILDAEAAAEQTRTLAAVIGSHTGTGNLILVTHEPNINAVSFELMRHADFLVLQPLGGSDFEELGVVRWDASE